MVENCLPDPVIQFIVAPQQQYHLVFLVRCLEATQGSWASIASLSVFRKLRPHRLKIAKFIHVCIFSVLENTLHAAFPGALCHSFESLVWASRWWGFWDDAIDVPFQHLVL
jgi:hypothetical protein